MTEELGNRLSEHFGAQGLRRLDAAQLEGLPLPDEARATVLQTGLPLQVGPYFFATEDEPLPVGEFASAIEAPHVQPDMARWLRLGTDQGAEICVTPSGAVQAVFVVVDVDGMQVNSSVPAFLESLLALDQALPLLRSPGKKDPVAVFRKLRSRLLQIDGAALRNDEDWWPRVLELIRHALSFPASVAFEVEEPGGRKRIETEETRVGVEHPEHLLWERLEAQGVRPEQVTRVYTELEPCFLPGNYCAMWLTQFPNADFTYSYDYGATAQERQAGLLELMKNTASR